MKLGFDKVASYGVCENFTLNIMFYILKALQYFLNFKIIYKLKTKPTIDNFYIISNEYKFEVEKFRRFRG